MRLDRNNSDAVRGFEDWVRRELYGPESEPAKDDRPQQATEPKDVKK